MTFHHTIHRPLSLELKKSLHTHQLQGLTSLQPRKPHSVQQRTNMYMPPTSTLPSMRPRFANKLKRFRKFAGNVLLSLSKDRLHCSLLEFAQTLTVVKTGNNINFSPPQGKTVHLQTRNVGVCQVGKEQGLQLHALGSLHRFGLIIGIQFLL